MKDWLGYILLFAAVAGILGGLTLVSHETPAGWVGIVGGTALAFAAYRTMARNTQATRVSKPKEKA